MTPLAERLIRRIELSGPMTVADYMTECLLDPQYGYYTTADPLGRAGDFITAPEISQMFGECIGLALAQSWLDQGAVAQFALTELGPGRGTLMADMLRATRGVPGFADAAEVHLVDASPVLRRVQAETLSGNVPVWHDDASTLPDLPLFLVANEFFDALPVRQFLRDGAGWRERVIGLSGGALALGLTDLAPVAALEPRLSDTRDGDLVEVCAAGEAIAGDLGGRIARHGGVAFVVDYGSWGSAGDTFQAVRAHDKVDPLATPGQADLTAHVNFRALAEAAAPAAHAPLTSQGVFLERLGITARAQALARNLTGAALETHIAAHHRLTHPVEMGSLFEVLALYPAQASLPPGVQS